MNRAPLEAIDERADGDRGLNEMPNLQGTRDLFGADPMQTAAGGAAALRTIGCATKHAGLDTRFEVGGIVDGHFREETVLRTARGINKGPGNSGVHEELWKSLAKARKLVRNRLPVVGREHFAALLAN